MWVFDILIKIEKFKMYAIKNKQKPVCRTSKHHWHLPGRLSSHHEERFKGSPSLFDVHYYLLGLRNTVLMFLKVSMGLPAFPNPCEGQKWGGECAGMRTFSSISLPPFILDIQAG